MKKPEFKKGDVVVIWDTRNFCLCGESEQNVIINSFAIPLGIVKEIDSYRFRASVNVYDTEFNHYSLLNFDFKSLEKIDHIDPNKKSWGELEPEG